MLHCWQKSLLHDTSIQKHWPKLLSEIDQIGPQRRTYYFIGVSVPLFLLTETHWWYMAANSTHIIKWIHLLDGKCDKMLFCYYYITCSWLYNNNCISQTKFIWLDLRARQTSCCIDELFSMKCKSPRLRPSVVYDLSAECISKLISQFLHSM